MTRKTRAHSKDLCSEGKIVSNDALYNSERKFRFASEQANVYAWEYDIATKEMRPCFRCMRELNVPPVVYNYPEPLIDRIIVHHKGIDKNSNTYQQIEIYYRFIGKMIQNYICTFVHLTTHLSYGTIVLAK
ncbi:MAG: DUF4368 domain-containing protein [Ruminococcus sp.]|nr:DUF4368 domain-containing protein [Ruminococcus sp.]